VRLVAYFDGACEPRNPGGVATYGWAIFRAPEEGGAPELLREGRGCVARGGPRATNNVAEYSALIFALEALLDLARAEPLGPMRVEVSVRGDSQLVVRQVVGAWACRALHLRPAVDRARALLRELERSALEVALAWVPREENAYADALSKRAYKDVTGRDAPARR
jgi:ribonuclease HI